MGAGDQFEARRLAGLQAQFEAETDRNREALGLAGPSRYSQAPHSLTPLATSER